MIKLIEDRIKDIEVRLAQIDQDIFKSQKYGEDHIFTVLLRKEKKELKKYRFIAYEILKIKKGVTRKILEASYIDNTRV